MDRQATAGWFVDRIALDGRVTVFTRRGRWLDILLGAGVLLTLLSACLESWNLRRKEKHDA